jgi:hypothetical protein
MGARPKPGWLMKRTGCRSGPASTSSAKCESRSSPSTTQPTLERVPEGLVVFASDYPHPEGSEDAVGLYEAQIAGVSEAGRAAFFGESAAKWLRVEGLQVAG